jgi:hypothetical protein
MGLGSYFKSSKKADKDATTATKTADLPPLDEKVPKPFGPYGHGSSRASISPSVRSSSRTSMMEEIKHEVMVNYLFQQQCARMWIGDGTGESEGILIRKTKTSYLACPPDLITSRFAAGVMALNLPCAMTVNSRVVKTYLAWDPHAVDVPLKGGLRVQVLQTMEQLPMARKAQSAAFVAAEGLLIVWSDESSELMPRAGAIESELMDLVRAD